MSDDVERRLAEAAEEAERQKQTKEFLEGLTKNDEILRPIYNPEAWVMRDKAKGAALRGELPRSECKHSLQYMHQYHDEDPSVARKGNPVNLYACDLCGALLWFVDAWGTPVADG